VNIVLNKNVIQKSNKKPEQSSKQKQPKLHSELNGTNRKR
jgi:hypothetical protein